MGKDPNKPRGRTTAYAFFVMEEKEKYQKANPGVKINFGDFSKQCGKKWQGMDEDAREPFDEKASEDKIRYDREMADYKPPAGAAKGKKGAKKRKKDPNAPKRPQTAFFVFSTKHREAVKKELGEGVRVGDIAKRLGEKWKELADEDKTEYNEEAARQKVDYDKAMEEYRNGAKKAKQESDEEKSEPDQDQEDEENDY